MEEEISMKKKQQGFSLVELVVVIAIMVVMTTGIAMSLKSVDSQKTKGAINTSASVLAYAQSQAMSKASAYCKIALNDKGDSYEIYNAYYQEGQWKESKKSLCSSKVTITYLVDTESTPQTITKDKPLILSYEKSSGRYLPVITKVQSTGEFVYGTKVTEGGSQVDVYCTEILFQNGGDIRRILLYPKTGKYEIVEN